MDHSESIYQGITFEELKMFSKHYNINVDSFQASRKRLQKSKKHMVKMLDAMVKMLNALVHSCADCL